MYFTQYAHQYDAQSLSMTVVLQLRAVQRAVQALNALHCICYDAHAVHRSAVVPAADDGVSKSNQNVERDTDFLDAHDRKKLC